jgi:hypothetical protein
MFTNLVILTAEFKIVTKVVIDSRNVMDREFQQRLVPKLKNKPKLEPATTTYLGFILQKYSAIWSTVDGNRI